MFLLCGTPWFEKKKTSVLSLSQQALRWLRLVVDEGQALGGGGASALSDGVVKFISRIAAERRWVMSGTPVTGDADSPLYTQRALRQLQVSNAKHIQAHMKPSSNWPRYPSTLYLFRDTYHKNSSSAFYGFSGTPSTAALCVGTRAAAAAAEAKRTRKKGACRRSPSLHGAGRLRSLSWGRAEVRGPPRGSSSWRRCAACWLPTRRATWPFQSPCSAISRCFEGPFADCLTKGLLILKSSLLLCYLQGLGSSDGGNLQKRARYDTAFQQSRASTESRRKNARNSRIPGLPLYINFSLSSPSSLSTFELFFHSRNRDISRSPSHTVLRHPRQSLCDKAIAKRIIEILRAARAAVEAGSRRLPDGSTDTRPIKALVYSTSRIDLLSIEEQLMALPEEEEGKEDEGKRMVLPRSPADHLVEENIAELIGQDITSRKVPG